MTHLRPFFSYFGAKYRTIHRYPRPLYQRVIEPFAGSASYACSCPAADVLLLDKDERVVEVWRYLIATPARELLALPLIEPGQSVDDLRAPEAARLLIGYWLNAATANPCKHLSGWGRRWPDRFWGPGMRERVARQVEHIRHWRVRLGSYEDLPLEAATWFVDPPYRGRMRASKTSAKGPRALRFVGDRYRHGVRGLDYEGLGAWCRTLPGQVVVCENVGATWLPFRPLVRAQSTSTSRGEGRSHEAIWCSDGHWPATQIDLLEAAR